MLTEHRKVKRYRCDHCKKLIPVGKQEGMVWMDGTKFSPFENRWYHFCNKSQWDKTFTAAYQLRLEFLEQRGTSYDET